MERDSELKSRNWTKMLLFNRFKAVPPVSAGKGSWVQQSERKTKITRHTASETMTDITKYVMYYIVAVRWKVVFPKNFIFGE